MKRALGVSVATIALAIAGCGGNDDDSTGPAEPEAAASPSEAIAEIAEVRDGLDEGLAKYRRGDAEEAEEVVGTAYLEHFELVEPPLEERDEELNEELEVLISTTIRDAIKAGESDKQVTGLVQEAKKGLAKAESELERG